MRLVGLWRDQPLKRILSSPFVRCVATVEPLAAALGLDVDERAELAEGSAGAALDMVHELVGEDAALCTHGDVIPRVLQGLERDGVIVADAWRWAKGSTWVLHADEGAFTRATYVPRPR